MTKNEKKVLVAMLKKQLDEAQKQWDEKGPDAAAYCYGYLIGTVKEVIYQLENQNMAKFRFETEVQVKATIEYIIEAIS